MKNNTEMQSLKEDIREFKALLNTLKESMMAGFANQNSGKIQESQPEYDKEDFFEIETAYNFGNDFTIFNKIANPQEFPLSKFFTRDYDSIGKKAVFLFSNEELPLLISKLREQETEETDSLADYIENSELESLDHEDLQELEEGMGLSFTVRKGKNIKPFNGIEEGISLSLTNQKGMNVKP